MSDEKGEQNKEITLVEVNRLKYAVERHGEKIFSISIKEREKILSKATIDHFQNIFDKLDTLNPEQAKDYIDKQLREIHRLESIAKQMGKNTTSIEQDRKILLENELKYLPTKETEPQPPPEGEELHTVIFRNNGYVLFEYLLNNNTAKELLNGRHADIGYWYRQMVINKKYITANIKDFTNWFFETYDEKITKIKDPDILNDYKNIRSSAYTSALVWFKQQNK